MQIKKARFLKSMKNKADYPQVDLPQIAVCGKSNVGKSSLINLLTNNAKLAKVSGSPGMMEEYFNAAESLRAFLILLDIRHQPTQDDARMFEWAAHFGLHVIIVATKADKVAKTKRFERLKAIKQTVGGGINYPIVAASALKKIGVDALLDEIQKAL